MSKKSLNSLFEDFEKGHKENTRLNKTTSNNKLYDNYSLLYKEYHKRLDKKSLQRVSDNQILNVVIGELKNQLPLEDYTLSTVKQICQKLSTLPSKILKPLVAIFNQTLDKQPLDSLFNNTNNFYRSVLSLSSNKLDLSSATKYLLRLQQYLFANKIVLPIYKYNIEDKILLEMQLEHIVKKPTISFKGLSQSIKNKIENIKSLQITTNKLKWNTVISCLMANQSYKNKYPKEFKKQMLCCIKNQLNNSCCNQKQLFYLVKRIIFFYTISSKLTLKEIQKNIKKAMQYILSLSTHKILPYNVLMEEFYLFVDMESSSFNRNKDINSKEILLNLIKTLKEVTKIPKVNFEHPHHLEILIWQLIDKEMKITEKIARTTKEILTTEIFNVLINNPKSPFCHIVNTSYNNLKKIEQIDQYTNKINFWTSQNDMVYSYLYVDRNDTILKLIQESQKEVGTNADAITIVEKVKQKFSNQNDIKKWSKYLETRIMIMYKYYWYSIQNKDRSSYESFIKWHTEKSNNNLQKTIRRLVPLFALEKKFC